MDLAGDHEFVGAGAFDERLHLLGYLERISWSPAIDIPASGLLIRPDGGDILRYSQHVGRRLAR